MYNDGCKNNPENSTTTKVSEHIPSGFSMSGERLMDVKIIPKIQLQQK